MDKIDGLNGIIAVLSSTLRKSQAAKSKTKLLRQRSSAAGDKKVSIQSLSDSVIDKIGKLDINESDYQAKAYRIIVESIMAWEFGDEILTDPELESVVSRIVDNIALTEDFNKVYEKYFNTLKK